MISGEENRCIKGSRRSRLKKTQPVLDPKHMQTKGGKICRLKGGGKRPLEPATAREILHDPPWSRKFEGGKAEMRVLVGLLPVVEN